MMVSEKQAGFSWCPFIRAPQATPYGGASSVVGGCNAQHDGSKIVNRTSCIGSQCMSWRWAGWKIADGDHTPIAPNPLEEDKMGPRLGYCGLAGKPYGAV